MKVEQEPKYDVNADGRIVNRATGIAIPDDEPVMIFRARDKHAASMLLTYLGLCQDAQHRSIVADRINDFIRFAASNPDRMKEPDSPA